MHGKILVTGLSGFVGQHLERYLQTHPLELVNLRRIELLNNRDNLLEQVLQNKPDYVVHLASKTYVPDSFKNPKEMFDVNFYGTFNLLQALTTARFKGVLLYVSSSEVYGFISENQLPITEQQLLNPINPYGVSKVAAERLCYQWHHNADFKIVIARPFNHIGVGQDTRFAISGFIKQIVEIKKGSKKNYIKVGDLECCRDFTNVKDIVRAYLLLLEFGKSGEVYNVCSGKSYRIGWLLEQLLKSAGINPEIRQDIDRLRPTIARLNIIGSYAKLYQCCRWQPEIGIEETLRILLQGMGKE